MVTDETLFTDEFVAMLELEEPNYDCIRAHIIRSYNLATGSNIEESISSDDDELFPVSQWLNRLLMSYHPRAHFFRKKPILLAVFSSDLSSKFGSISQFHCPFCKGNAPVAIIPIRIRPTSYQASDSRTKRAFKKAINGRLSDVHHYGNKRLCVHVTFVIGKKPNRRDVDNIAKLLLDGLQGQILEDDNQIDHLSLLRLTWEGDEEFIVLNIRDSNVNRHEDVLYRGFNHSWAGQEALLLEDFMDM